MNNFSATSLLTFLLLSLSFAQATEAQTNNVADTHEPSLTFIYIIRHAEKQSGKDPSLKSEGLQRAENYGVIFSHLNIKQIYASKYKRNQETATPIAKALGLKLSPFDPFDYAGFATRLIAKSGKSGNSIVVAHSDLTVLLTALGAPAEPEIDHEDYSRLYQITLLDKQFLSLQRLTSINR